MLINDIYLSNVKTFESLSESTLQLGFNGYVMKEFGVENAWIQIGSVILSMLSIFRSVATRYAFVQCNKDPGFSINLAKSLAILFFPIGSMFLFQIISWTDESTPPSVGLYQMFLIHPILLGICGQFSSKIVSPLLRSTFGSLHLLFLTSVLYCGGVNLLYVSYLVSFITYLLR